MNSHQPDQQTDELRRNIRRQLNAMPEDARRRQTGLAIHHFVSTRTFRNSRHIALYFPVRHELDILPLYEHCWSLGKTVYLPCLGARPVNKLHFLPFRPGSRLRKNRYGIPEPDMHIARSASPWQLDLVLTPLLAFGRNGERLGTGGGYYDRSFAYLNRMKHYRRPKLWAIALSFQQLELQARPWDVPLQGISTELGNLVT